MMRFPEARLLVFAKAPRPGAVKTRLIQPLGAEGAAALHAALLEHALKTVTAAALSPVELWCAPHCSDPFFQGCAARYPLALREQTGAELGERMARAFEDALRSSPYAVLTGSDCPALTAEHLQSALQLLHEGRDAVIAPACDGGYVLIGLRRVSIALFADIQWGTSAVMEATRARLRRLKWQWEEIETLPDIDVAADLRHLPPGLIESA